MPAGQTMPRKNDNLEFPQTVKAVREVEDLAGRADGGVWRIGDALITECGPPGAHGVNSGSNGKIKRAAVELKRLGFAKYGLSYLRLLRSTADAFKHANRLASVPWSVHLDAGDPETLRAVQKRSEQEHAKLTRSYVKRFKLRRAQEAAEKERRKHEKLNGPRPDPAREIAKSAFLSAVAQAQSLAEEAKRRIAPHIAELSQTELTDLFNAAASVAEAWGSLADTVGKPDTVVFQRAAE